MTPALITLTHAERDRFAAYCKQEARTAGGLVEQMQANGVPDGIQKKLKMERAAFLLVYDHLTGGEQVVIRG